jgi:hypothetical protein
VRRCKSHARIITTSIGKSIISYGWKLWQQRGNKCCRMS